MAASIMTYRLYLIFHPVRHSSCSMQRFNKMTMSDQLVIVPFNRTSPNLLSIFLEGISTEASMDPANVAIMFTWSSCFMLTCRDITRHDDMKYVNMAT